MPWTDSARPPFIPQLHEKQKAPIGIHYAGGAFSIQGTDLPQAALHVG